MILFCLPYAGGSESIYYRWKKYTNPNIQIEPIRLKGRGSRFGEDFYENLEEAVNDIFMNIKNKIIDNEYAIFGYSMGSLLAYELYYKILNENYRIPKHIFFSAYKAPDVCEKSSSIYKLQDDEFIKIIIKLGGTPIEVIENKELLNLAIPILRSDFRILENYVYKKKKEKINCGISILYGKNDNINLTDLLAWKKFTNKEFKMYNFEDGHFFINNNVEKIIDIVNRTLF